jgi:hypothetical protein
MQSSIDSAGLGGYDGNITLAYSFAGAFGDLVVGTGSVDQTGTYVFEVPDSPAGQTLAKGSPFWTTAGGSDTMFTLWNSGGAPEDLVATFTWNGMSGRYRFTGSGPADGEQQIARSPRRLTAASLRPRDDRGWDWTGARRRMPTETDGV